MVEVTSQPKFDKRKCLKCKYHSTLANVGYAVRKGKNDVIYPYCNYAGVTKSTCLRKSGKETEDIRGNDYYSCRLFERKGKDNGKQ